MTDEASNSAAYWEGWQACQTRQPCRYNEPADRTAWAEGFAQAVREGHTGKKWYKSRTLWGMIFLAVAGVGLFLAGCLTTNQTAGYAAMAGGGGLSVGSLVSMGFRLITSQPMQYGQSWPGGYYQQQ